MTASDRLQQDDRDWSADSLASAMRGMEHEDTPQYSEADVETPPTSIREMGNALASPLDIAGVETDATMEDVIEAIRESRERDY